MVILSIVIIAFLVLESLNIMMLYFAPGLRYGNGVGVFNAYEKSKADPEVFALVSYLINWVAGTKLIFVLLLIGVVITGNLETKLFSVIALVFSILSFFWRLYPAIRKMDADGQVTPAGYSRTLALMIASFIAMFAAAAVVFLVFFRGA